MGKTPKSHPQPPMYLAGLLTAKDVSFDAIQQWQASLAVAWSQITGTPTTLAGYGITDAYTKVASDARYALIGHTHTYAALKAGDAAWPTTLAGYGITDAASSSALSGYLPLTGGTLSGPGDLTVSGVLTANTGVIVSGSSVDITRGLSSNGSVRIYVSGDTVPRLQVLASGQLSWSDGSAASDTALFRGAANLLQTGGNTSLYVAQSMAVGTVAPLTNIAGTTYFAGVTPRLAVLTGTDNGTYEEMVSIRHANKDATAVLRRLGILMKLSAEGSTTESRKSGGLILESSNASATLPSLHVLLQDVKVMSFSSTTAASMVTSLDVTGALTNGGVQVSLVGHTHAAADIVSGTVAVARLGTGTPTVDTLLKGDGTWGLATQASITPIWYSQREQFAQKIPQNSSWSAFGVPSTNPVNISTAPQQDESQTDCTWSKWATTAVGGNANGGTVAFGANRTWGGEYECDVRTSVLAALTDVGIWCGLFAAALNPDNNYLPVSHYAAFRFYTRRSSTDATAIDNTNFWRCVTVDGVAATTTTTTQSIAADTRYKLRIKLTSTNVLFYINDVLVATHTTNLPGATQNLTWRTSVTNLNAAAQDIRISRFAGRQV